MRLSDLMRRLPGLKRTTIHGAGDHPSLTGWEEYTGTEPLYALLEASAARFNDRPCLSFLGKSYSYAEISDLVNRAAEGFQQAGVVKGTRVGLLLPNTPYFVICYYAILRAGGTVVNYNPLYVGREIEHQIEDSETDIMVTLDLKQLYPKVARALDNTRLKKIVICRMSDILPPVKGLLFSTLKRSELADVPEDLLHIPFDLLTKTDGAPAPVNIDIHNDVAVLQYTGGTTGLPKGAMLTHANLVANTRQLQRIVTNIVEGEERILAVLPFFHVFAMTAILNHGISMGAELILLPRFELEQLLKTIDSRQPTIFHAVPTIYTAINGCTDLSKYKLSCLKFCISGGAPLPAEVKRQFEEKTGCALVEGYGLSEASPVVSVNPVDSDARDGSIGRALPGTDIKFLSLEAPYKEVNEGDNGELCVKGPQVMRGYWQRPDETAAVLKDGYLHTGDVGYRDKDGFLYLVDRVKDLIICSGYNVYPRVIEDAIYLHPAVNEVTVIGIPDDYRGQSPKAFVTLNPGATVTEEELRRFLTDKLSPIERPHSIEFRDELPKTMIGKLSKKELVAEQADQESVSSDPEPASNEGGTGTA
jgi:long-chain acyl-CoA synthetase